MTTNVRGRFQPSRQVFLSRGLVQPTAVDSNGPGGPHPEHQVAESWADRMAVTGEAVAQRTTLCPSPAANVGQTSFRYCLG